jgi:glycerol-3-phosphate dehydrogenase (NAD(P)+)
MNDFKKIGVIGAGSWGTALAITLSNKGHDVKIWDINKEHLEALKADRENVKYLSGVKFGDKLQVADTIKEVIDDARMILFSAPAQHFRSALDSALPYISQDVIVVNVAKGIEQKTLKRMSEIAHDKMANMKYVSLSGPSHAEEVGIAQPTTVVVASNDIKLAEYVQEIFITDKFRVYTSSDLIGVELGGALKNIIALGAGISDGMGYGDNAKAAMMTRGMVEISRLGVKLGADVHTFSGLTGIGDLIVTCTSMHSRNRRCGIMIGEGMKPSEATEKVGMVVEGMFTTEAAYELAKREGVEMPITEGIYAIINDKIDARDAVNMLMTREKKSETVV